MGRACRLMPCLFLGQPILGLGFYNRDVVYPPKKGYGISRRGGCRNSSGRNSDSQHAHADQQTADRNTAGPDAKKIEFHVDVL